MEKLRRLTLKGIAKIDVFRMATINTAELLGVDDRGELVAGKRAAIIAVPSNPLKDITLMESVSFVMKQSEIYKQ
jgi:imidazolonepropionase-like amidohydrolase